MTYRDEREALQNQVAALQDDLVEARAEAAANDQGAVKEKAAALETQVATMKVELARMESELAKLRGPTPLPPTRSRTAVSIGIGLVVLGIGAAAAFVAGRSSRPPPPRDDEIAEIGQLVEDVKALPPTPPPDLMAEMKRRAASPPPTATAAEPVERIEVQWVTRVKSAHGIAVSPGSGCKLIGTIDRHGDPPPVDSLEMVCGTKKVYSSLDDLNGISMLSSHCEERKVNDTLRYSIQYADKGNRSGPRNQLDLDSKKHLGVVFDDNVASAFRIEFIVVGESDPIPYPTK